MVTWLRTDESNEWPVNFNDLEIIPQSSESSGPKNEEPVAKVEENKELEPVSVCEASDETNENTESEVKEETNDQNESEQPVEEVKIENENPTAENKDENDQKLEQESKKEDNTNESTSPNSNQALALAQSATPNGTLVASTTPNETVKAAVNAYPKPTAYTAYRHAMPTTLNPFVYQPTAMGIRIPYASPQIPQTIGGFSAQPFLNQTIQSPLQQQVYLCRGPNGLTYVTAAPGLVQNQLAAAQQAQAQAVFQHQLLQAQQQAALLQKIPSNQTIINGQIFSNTQSNAIQQVQQTPQIIYQAAPQPASQKPAQSVQQNSNVTQPQVQQAPQTQSPKSTNANNQINGQAAILGYNAQSGQQMYAPSPSAQAAIATQQGYMLAGASIQNQNQQLQQLQQLQQQQLLNYQLAAAGNLGLNGYTNQAAAQAGLSSGQNIGSIPVGYQLVDYRQLQGLQGTVSLDQLAGIQRSRLLQARHHPYQRP